MTEVEVSIETDSIECNQGRYFAFLLEYTQNWKLKITQMVIKQLNIPFCTRICKLEILFCFSSDFILASTHIN